MIKIKNHYWLLPLIGGILSIIGIFIPSWYSITVYDENIWMWGLIERITVSEFDFLHAELLILGLITVILILISSIVSISDLVLRTKCLSPALSIKQESAASIKY